MSDQGAEGLLSPFLKSQRLKKVRKYIKGSVLDFGCGTGDLGRFCSPETYLGFDIDSHSLSIAQEKNPHLRFTDHFPSSGFDGKYDSIVLAAVIEHVEDPASLLMSLKKHLSPDGRIVITTPHPSLEWAHTLGVKFGVFSAEASKEHKTLLDKDYLNRIAFEAKLSVLVYERFLLGANQLVVMTEKI